MRLARDELRLHFGAYFSDLEIMRCREPFWLTGELCATPSARARLVQWFEGGGLARPAPTLETLVYYGDVEMRPAVREALACLPPPVRHVVCEEAVILGTGWSSGGWTGACPAPRPRVVLLAGDTRCRRQIRDTALHECAHVWLEAPSSLATAAQAAAIQRLATADGWAGQVRLHRDTVERRARRLAGQWGAAAPSGE